MAQQTICGHCKSDQGLEATQENVAKLGLVQIVRCADCGAEITVMDRRWQEKIEIALGRIKRAVGIPDDAP